MTFDEWYTKVFLPNLPSYRGFVRKQDMMAAWDAAIESTKTKVEPLTEEQLDELFPFKGYYDKNTQRLDLTEGRDFDGTQDR